MKPTTATKDPAPVRRQGPSLRTHSRRLFTERTLCFNSNPSKRNRSSFAVRKLSLELLVGGISAPPEKYELVKWDDEIPNIWKNKKCSKPQTRLGLQDHKISDPPKTNIPSHWRKHQFLHLIKHIRDPHSFQWEFQDPEMEVPYHIYGHIKEKHRPYLVGGFNRSEKYESQLGWWNFQDFWNNQSNVPVTSRYEPS